MQLTTVTPSNKKILADPQSRRSWRFVNNYGEQRSRVRTVETVLPTNLIAMASNLIAMASSLIAIASTIIAMASNL